MRETLEDIVGRLGGAARADAVYGEPVTADGVTVIPVARAEWGFGGGTGPADEGGGAGGGIRVRPVGFIEMRDGHARFRPIVDPARMVFIAALAGVTGALLLRVAQRRQVI